MNTPARLLILALLLCLAPVAAQARRLALVIGNDAYQHATPLQKAGNDAVAMAGELRTAGFDVVLHRDLNYRQTVRALESFYNSITGGDEVVVFFAGHGVQIKSGNYLLPIDIEANSESEIEKTSYGLTDLMEQLSAARAAFALVLVDACRDNPLKGRGRNLPATRGLSPPEPPKGQMVVYSASRGQQALDRLDDRDANPNGVFTREFITRMRRPGLRVEELVREVQDSVERLARSVSHDQRPALYNEARGHFYFHAPVAAAAPAGGAAPAASAMDELRREDRFWDDAKSTGNREAFEAYLDQYRNGRYASLARANLQRLAGTGAGSPPAVTTAAARPAAETPPMAIKVPPAAPATAPAATGTERASGTMVAAADSRRTPGRTRVTLPNGDRYEGETVGALRTGTGVYIFVNGDRYEGDFADDHFHGKGTHRFASGDVYRGDYQRSVRVGQGVYEFANGDRYEGPFADNAFHGKGKKTFKSGDSYEGEFVNGIQQGPGIYRYANGDRYEGNFVDAEFTGTGKLTLANGDRYEGEFRKGMKEGKGTHFFANGERYEGQFRGGVQSGTGTHFHANGDRYTGEFANGVRHGKGSYIFSGGQAQPMEFAGGVEKR